MRIHCAISVLTKWIVISNELALMSTTNFCWPKSDYIMWIESLGCDVHQVDEWAKSINIPTIEWFWSTQLSLIMYGQPIEFPPLQPNLKTNQEVRNCTLVSLNLWYLSSLEIVTYVPWGYNTNGMWSHCLQLSHNIGTSSDYCPIFINMLHFLR